jgi:hypothetical protein
MHIITPAYPEYNSTDKVKNINFNIIVGKITYILNKTKNFLIFLNI